MELLSAAGRDQIPIGDELGRGGEGTVYALRSRSDLVVKVYASPPPQPKADKLRTMVDAATREITSVAAWPVDLVVDRQSRLRGFLMPSVRARRDIHELYSPKSRLEAFPGADLRFLVHVAANIARAFATLHRAGHVLGDVNHGNLLIGADGTVMLIDCDSFQIAAAGRVFTCDVGVELFTPPELQDRPFRGLVRTSSHDCFGLAVLLFHLLFMGRHPFAGRYLGRGEMPIAQAIAENRFAYGPDRASHQMERPPATPPLEAMGPEVAALFSRAFAAPRGGEKRPAAERWVGALNRLAAVLKPCSEVDRHYFPASVGSCPWCRIEALTGVFLFGRRLAVPSPAGTIDVAALWRSIEGVPDPGPDPRLPSEREASPLRGFPLLKTARQLASVALVAGALVACSTSSWNSSVLLPIMLLVFAIGVWPRPPADRVAAADQAVSAARLRWQTALSSFRRECSGAIFATKLEELRTSYCELRDFPTQRSRRLAQLQREREVRQHERYLDRFRISRAKIPKIGSERTAMLASYGVESAADVDYRRIVAIPGFGKKLTSALIRWRDGHANNFRFNPRQPVDPRDIAALQRELANKELKLLAALRAGPRDLQDLHQQILTHRPGGLRSLEEAWVELTDAQTRRRRL